MLRSGAVYVVVAIGLLGYLYFFLSLAIVSLWVGLVPILVIEVVEEGPWATTLASSELAVSRATANLTVLGLMMAC